VPDVILPVLDEAASLPVVLASVPVGYRPIVVDNGSTDGSSSIARDLGAYVIVERRRGFGAACWAGLLAATDPIVCFMDCDGSLSGTDLPTVVAPLLAGDTDLVLGARHGHGLPWHARLANRALAWTVRRRAGAPLSDIGPMRAMHREALLDLDLQDRRFGWPLEMVLRAAEAGWRICEVPVTHRARLGRSKVTGTVRGTAQAIHDMGRLLW
jgi:glycosyltransferase involved in cell wall biosynthesis